jgi:hypothetical protein
MSACLHHARRAETEVDSMQCFTKQNYMVVVYVGANWSTSQLVGTFVFFYIILHNQILIAFLAAFKSTP